MITSKRVTYCRTDTNDCKTAKRKIH